MRLGLSLIAVSLYLFAYKAQAFCGFYVSGGDAKIFNNATQVVLMREGTLTVLSRRLRDGHPGACDLEEEQRQDPPDEGL
jgi:hypothetical protein